MKSLFAVAFLILLGGSEAFAPPSSSNAVEKFAFEANKVHFPAATTKARVSGGTLTLSAETKEGEKQSTTSGDLDLLEDALINFKSDAAKKILEKLRGLRSTNMDASISYINKLLEEGPDSSSLPGWAAPLLLSRFSKRARLASLKRTLDMTTPPPEDDTEEITPEDQQRRRRRALVALLQTLASDDTKRTTLAWITKRPAIRTLEKKARVEQSATSSSSSSSKRADMLSRRPPELETPRYEVIRTSNEYEIRSYDSFSVCSVDMNQARPAESYKTDATVSDPNMKGARAFGALAGYLFGKNKQQSAMKMTTPVLTSNYGTDEKQMSFVLPSEYWGEGSLISAPQPLEGSGVSLQTQPPSNRAVAMFGGYAAKAQVEKQKLALLEALSKDTKWEMIPNEEVSLAQYNDPFTPPWKRLNEVSVKVQPKQ